MYLTNLRIVAPPKVMEAAKTFNGSRGSLTAVMDALDCDRQEATALLVQAKAYKLTPQLCQHKDCLNLHAPSDVSCPLHHIPKDEWLPVRALRNYTLPLLARGWSTDEIEHAAGLPEGTLRQWDKFISHRLARRVMQLDHQQLVLMAQDMPACGDVRRLQALLAAGHGLNHLAFHLRLTPEQVKYFALEEPHEIPIRASRKIREYYTQHSTTPPQMPEEWAALMPWALPTDWEDIDNDPPPLKPPRATVSQSMPAGVRWAIQDMKRLYPHLNRQQRAKLLGVNDRAVSRWQRLEPIEQKRAADMWRAYKNILAAFERQQTCVA